MSIQNIENLNDKQIDNLHGFHLHCWNVYHMNGKSNFEFYAKLLDELNISWPIQNTVAIMAETRENAFYYFKPQLKKALEKLYWAEKTKSALKRVPLTVEEYEEKYINK